MREFLHRPDCCRSMHIRSDEDMEAQAAGAVPLGEGRRSSLPPIRPARVPTLAASLGLLRRLALPPHLRIWRLGLQVGEDYDNLYILTCAHVLGPVFNSSNPIHADAINHIYEVYIVCDHCEEMFRMNEGTPRLSTLATVHAASCYHDLLLIKVEKNRLALHCNMPHDIILFASRFPSPLSKVIMLSWPCTRNRTVVSGHISHGCMDFGDLALVNPFGLTTKLAEVDITSGVGSSGALILNDCGEGVGLLHGGDGQYSYFIPLDVIRLNMSQWGDRSQTRRSMQMQEWKQPSLE